MHCAHCGRENEAGAKFCEECGTQLVRVCPSCGRELRPTAKFCPGCGTLLTAEVQSPKSQVHRPNPKLGLTEHASSDGERRQLTVMFCDLVGSTALSVQLDPEELREVVRAYQRVSAEVIARFDGHIAQYLGDGLLVYFGYPRAHEDDAQRAVRAGLEIVEALQHLPYARHQVPSPLVGEPVLSPVEGGQGEGAFGSARTVTFPHPSLPPQGGKEKTDVIQPLQVRIGIHTGPVVVGEIGGGTRREQLALGETPNIAARIQSLAAPDTIVVSAATHRLVHGLFTCQDLGTHALKGFSTPLSVYGVLSESSTQSRLEVEVSTGKLTPLVGRAHELGLILERWTAAQAGDGQVVLVSGEPGIGKSRLVQEIKTQVAQAGATYWEFRCSPYYQNSAFSPVLTHLQRVLQFQRDETPQAKLDKLQQMLARYRFPQADTLPLLAALLSLPQPAGALPLNVSPQKQKQKTQEALVAWIVEEAERAPVYCAWEDLHWVDPSTLELLGLLLAQVPTTRLLVLLTCRPEFIPSWSNRTHLTPLTLTRLPRTQAAELIEKVTGGKPLPAEVRQQIVSKTDGVPLFVEELTKMVLESGVVREENGRYTLTGALLPLAIPTTLHDSLMARLDRLATVKEVAQLGATLGREFSYELLQAVTPGEEGSLQQALAKLVEAELLYQRGLPPQARYVFKHALIQDTAYQSLLKSKRQQYHKQIAQVLEERFPETRETQPELLAHHYTEAGLIAQAIPYWQQAGQRAVERSANVEAISHFTTALELLKTLPTTPEHVRQELTLQISLAVPLASTKGWAVPEVEDAYARGRELCRQVGETPQLFPVLYGLRTFYHIRGELRTARELAEQLLRLAQQGQAPDLLLEAYSALGTTLFFVGELTSTRAYIEQGILLYNPQQYHSHIYLYSMDTGVILLGFVAWTFWFLGYPDQAQERNQEVLTLAQELAHPYSLAWALIYVAWFHQYRREGQAAQARAEAAIALATEQGFAQILAWGTVARGWALAEQGEREEGIKQMRQGLAALQDMGAGVMQSWVLALLAEAHHKMGQAEEGLPLLAEALAIVNNKGEHFYEAELYRLKGELTLQSKVQGPKPQVEKEAEECFLKAIGIARKQQAKSLELRTVMGLSRLWQQQGKKEEARQILAEIYGWFTEGFDTADLQEARALLAEKE